MNNTAAVNMCSML
jgi:hypothetical protein